MEQVCQAQDIGKYGSQLLWRSALEAQAIATNFQRDVAPHRSKMLHRKIILFTSLA